MFFYTHAQSGDKYFKDKDYHVLFMLMSAKPPSILRCILNLAKSYFALQNFEKAVGAINLYKTKTTNADKTYADQLLTLLQRDDELVKVENLGATINSNDHNFLPKILYLMEKEM